MNSEAEHEPNGESPATEITVEKQREIARWSVGRLPEEIASIATLLGREPSAIYAWRRKYVTEASDPIPKDAGSAEDESAATATTAPIPTSTSAEQIAVAEKIRSLSEAEKIELAKWSLDKSDREMTDRMREYGYDGGGMLYQWRKKYLPRETVRTKRGWKPEEREALAKEYLALGSQSAWDEQRPDIASGMVRRWIRELGLDKERAPNWRSAAQLKAEARKPQADKQEETNGMAKDKAPGEEPERYETSSRGTKKYTERFMKYALGVLEARLSEGAKAKDVAKALGVPGSKFAYFRRELGLPPSRRSELQLQAKGARPIKGKEPWRADAKVRLLMRNAGPEPERFVLDDRNKSVYSDDWKRWALKVAEAVVNGGFKQAAAAAAINTDHSNFAKFRIDLGLAVKRPNVRTTGQPGRPPHSAKPPVDLLPPPDRALLTNRHKSEPTPELRKLRLQNKVLLAVIQDAAEQGYEVPDLVALWGKE